MTTRCRMLLVSGSLRQRSTSTAVLRTACLVAPSGVDATLYDGLGHLPHFNPDDDVDPLHPAVAGLRAEVRRADALLLSTPEYAGALPGSFKNLLDWTVGDDQQGSISEKPVAWINASPRGARGAHDSLRTVLGYTKATVVEAACAAIPVPGAMVDEEGLISDPSVLDHLARALTTLADHAARPAAAG